MKACIVTALKIIRIKLFKAAHTLRLLGIAALVATFWSSFSQAQTTEIIVDNGDENTSRIGTWRTSSGEFPFFGDSLYNNGGGTFTWLPRLNPGTYDVYAWWTHAPNRSSMVPYRINHAGGVTSTVFADQQNPDLAGQWNLLGTFTFPSSIIPEISVSSENGQASADAIRLVLRPSPQKWPDVACRCDVYFERAIADLAAAGTRFTTPTPPTPSSRRCTTHSALGSLFVELDHEEFPRSRADEQGAGADASLPVKTEMHILLGFEFADEVDGMVVENDGSCSVTTSISWPEVKTITRSAHLSTPEQFDACTMSVEDLCDRWSGNEVVEP